MPNTLRRTTNRLNSATMIGVRRLKTGAPSRCSPRPDFASIVSGSRPFPIICQGYTCVMVRGGVGRPPCPPSPRPKRLPKQKAPSVALAGLFGGRELPLKVFPNQGLRCGAKVCGAERLAGVAKPRFVVRNDWRGLRSGWQVLRNGWRPLRNRWQVLRNRWRGVRSGWQALQRPWRAWGSRGRPPEARKTAGI